MQARGGCQRETKLTHGHGVNMVEKWLFEKGKKSVANLTKPLPMVVNYYFRQISSCGQSYKHFMLVIYDSRVVICGIFKSDMPQGS